MKILQLVNRVPYPLHDGGNIGVHYFSKGFIDAGVSLSMLAMNTSRHRVNPAELPDFFKTFQRFEMVAVDNRVKVLPAFLNLFKSSSYNIDRFISRAFSQRLLALLREEDYDIIQLESLFLTPYLPIIRAHSRAKVVIRQHNVEFKIWERMAEKEPNRLKKAYLNLLARRLKAFEVRHLNDYDLILPISRPDQALLQDLGARRPMFLQPFGIATGDTPFMPAPEASHSVYHIGAMDWLPNQESMYFFLDRVMPLLKQRIPALKFYMAGRNMPEKFRAYAGDDIHVVGEVPDATAFEKDKGLLVVPLQSGGGVRIKIFQAMAMGKTVITTPVGMEGIEAEHGKHLLVAVTPEDFVRQIESVVGRPERLFELGRNARALIEQEYDRKLLISRLLKRYQRLLEG